MKLILFTLTIFLLIILSINTTAYSDSFPELDDFDTFGNEIILIGDFDGDGITDLVVGASEDDDGGTDKGAVYILFLNDDATVKSYQKISDTAGNFDANLSNDNEFGMSSEKINDFNGDGITDLVVGASEDDDGGTDKGAVYILFLNDDATVKSYQKISDTAGNFDANLNHHDGFGRDISNIGDFDGDGITDLAVGAYRDDDGGTDKGAVYILFLNDDATVKSYQKISDTAGNFDANLDDYDEFGTSLTAIGDFDGDGITDLVVGASEDDDGGTDKGAVYILFLNDDATVKSYQKISDTAGNFSSGLNDNDTFGRDVSNIGDFNGDGITDLAVGAYKDDDGGTDKGAVYILFLNDDATVKSYQKISDTAGNFDANLDDYDFFGRDISNIGDFDGDGITDLAVGAYRDDDGGTDKGAVYILFLNDDATVKSYQKISDTAGNFDLIRMIIDFFRNIFF